LRKTSSSLDIKPKKSGNQSGVRACGPPPASGGGDEALDCMMGKRLAVLSNRFVTASF